MDWNSIKDDLLIGDHEIDFSDLQKERTMWVDIKKKDKVTGRVHIKMELEDI